MTLSRRDAIKVSGSAMAGLSMGVVNPENVLGQAVPEQE
ncbi:MAG TPA: twin-arginine translocation signal domain-containing protein, partial [Gemmatimonadetes bacterium]|nr:twin-arginine translocation signal domain-containing protein [Gemmatimonadota bacterium]